MTVFVLAVVRINGSVCQGCRVVPVDLQTPSSAVSARLFLPSTPFPVPAVVIAHGYLASGAMMEAPWVSDLSAIGVAALVLDRPGHGRSAGALWPAKPVGTTIRNLADATPEITAALLYLRSMGNIIDPSRIGLFGHSDGAAAVLLEGSKDWHVHTTVAVSPSALPVQYLNKVGPRNLLAIFGSEDRFVEPETPVRLIEGATQGYLSGPGKTGTSAGQNARELRIIHGEGHVSVLFSLEARRLIAEWFQATFGVGNELPPRPADRQPAWSFIGVSAALLAFSGGQPQPRPRPISSYRRSLFLLPVWGAGLSLSLLFAPVVAWFPGREVQFVVTIIIAQTACLTTWAIMSRADVPNGDSGHRVIATAAGAAYALLFIGAIHLAVPYLPFVAVLPERLLLQGALAVFSSPFFVVFHLIVGTLQRPLVASLGATASLAAFGSLEAVRMSVLPVYLMAFSLLSSSLVSPQVVGTEAGGSRTVLPLFRAAFGSVIFGYLSGTVCALYA